PAQEHALFHRRDYDAPRQRAVFSRGIGFHRLNEPHAAQMLQLAAVYVVRLVDGVEAPVPVEPERGLHTGELKLPAKVRDAHDVLGRALDHISLGNVLHISTSFVRLPYYTKQAEILQQVQRNNAAGNYDGYHERQQQY